MITKVSLINWRSHDKNEVEFGKGTNVLIGKMGSGKSSVMNAICFGLFGTFPDLQTRKVKLDDVIMDKPSTEAESHIIVNFFVDGREYSVTRIIERGRGTVYSEIREGEVLIEAPNTQRVTEIVNDKLKLDYETFSRVVYSEQNGLDYFLRLPRGERMKRIDNLLMIDRFEKARTNSVTMHNKILDRKTGKQSLVEQFNESEIKESLKNLEYSIDKLNDTLEKISSELNEKSAKKISVEKELNSLEEEEKRLNSLLRKKESVESAITENKDSIEKITSMAKDTDLKKSQKRLENLESKILKLKNSVNEQRKKLTELNNENSSLNTNFEFLSGEIKKLESEILDREKYLREITEIQKLITSDPEKKINEMKDKVISLVKYISEKTSLQNQTKKSLDEISKLDDECPTCKSKITKTKRDQLVKLYRKEIDSLEKKIKKMDNQKLTEEKLLSEIETGIQRWRLISEKTSDTDTKKNDLEKKRQTLEKNSKQMKKIKKEISKFSIYLKREEDDLEKLNSEKSQIGVLVQRLEEIDNKKKRITELQKELSIVNKEIKLLSKKVNPEKTFDLKKEFQNLISRESELSSRVVSLKELINEKEKRKLEFEEKITILEKEKSEIKNLENIVRELKKFEVALKKTQVQLREKFITSVNSTMNEIWNDIYPYRDFVNARLYIKERDYVLQLETSSGRWIDVDGIASGGERSIASLVLRVAFSIVLAPQLRILVLDEPTANLDSRAVDDLAITLRDRVDDFMNQVFIVTHEKRLENAVTGYMYNFNRDKEVDEPTKVEVVN